MSPPLRWFAFAMVAFFALLWAAQWLFPASAAGAWVFVVITAIGVWIVRPGWNLRPSLDRYSFLLFGLVLASALGAAWFLRVSQLPLPFDVSTLNLVTAMPAILAIAGMEELFFRQVTFRWLERRLDSQRTVVLATALAYGAGHLGPLVTGSAVSATLPLVQSAFLIWIGVLLGEIRRASASWLMSWLGHFCYNAVVLYCLQR